MVDGGNTPQILEIGHQGLSATIYDTKWIPSSARFMVLGSHPRSTGLMQMYELQGTEMKLLKETEKKSSIKCGTFGASGLADRRLATGDFAGKLCIWDLERMNAPPVFETQAAKGYGAPELVTCGRDGCVRVWDVRQKDAPVAAFEPREADRAAPRDCWAVAFGNSYNDEERCVLAGYDNGDVKMFDLRTNKQRWATNVKNGVCAVSFDRKDIEMNKFMVSCLESQFHVFDARTQHVKKGFASVTEKLATGATVWGSWHLPQNRDVAMIGAGDGSCFLYKYHYPDQRRVKDPDGKPMGVAGSIELITTKNLSTQPICCFDWSPDKEGLCVMGSFDQAVRVGVVTKLHKL
uniref:Wd repeat-containing protein 92 n=1 Tax=Tetraselmis sp. GSL018 TaxID=582737 RepID=A0A061R9R5_9CHLO|eukprot:CAMPEP_0177587814 /NCGR_PEP_ID=MMETSP0419_2-20121207/5869_1 /TAXON_ID=582737 /ORGANISM="Tetraselmis sp., Strain GSL018" /LENGTH=348 /DNA_ID=CAMNT_0019077923 /DNA_START=73 /DNA_END=1119 /DNA_ORIENTATION=+